MDTQIIELIGRNYLTSELLKAGFEVAIPLRDRGVDLIAYVDVDDAITNFVGIPMQLKVASRSSFHMASKYNKFPDLIMVYVWNIDSDIESSIYALTQAEVVAIGDAMGYTQTASWQQNGLYASTRPSTKLLGLLMPHQMTPEKWRQKLLHSTQS